MTDDRLHDLITRHFHGALTAEEQAELSAELVRSPAACRVFAELSVLVVGLAGQFPRVAAPQPPRRTSRLRWVAAAAGLAAAVLVGVWALRPAPPAGAGYVAEIEAPTGEVRLGAARALAGTGIRVTAGQAVSTVGVTSAVTLRYPDGTRLVLAGDTTVTVGDGPRPRVVVDRGNVSADVPGDPMTIATPEAEVEAGRAVLSIGRRPDQTEVGVIEGTARVTDPAGTPLMDMGTGEHGTIAADGTTHKDRLAPTPDTYRWRTDVPLPSRWEVGRLTDDPFGGRAIVPALWDDPFIHRRCWQIRADSNWVRGLFLMHPDTRTRVRYKVDRPGEGQLLVVVRSDPPEPKKCNVLLAQVPFEPAPDGGWRTFDLTAADWLIEEIPGRPVWQFPRPWVAFLVVFNTYEQDLGLRVAEFTVGRGPSPE